MASLCTRMHCIIGYSVMDSNRKIENLTHGMNFGDIQVATFHHHLPYFLRPDKVLEWTSSLCNRHFRLWKVEEIY